MASQESITFVQKSVNFDVFKNEHFLSLIPNRPFASLSSPYIESCTKTHFMAKDVAISLPYLQLDIPKQRRFLAVNIDRAQLGLAGSNFFSDRGIGDPSWMSFDKEKNNVQIVWMLSTPVYVDSINARKKPQKLLNRALAHLCRSIDGHIVDPQKFMLRNPYHEKWVTIFWERKKHTLNSIIKNIHDLPVIGRAGGIRSGEARRLASQPSRSAAVAMRRNGMKQIEIAKALGVTQKTISCWLSTKNSLISKNIPEQVYLTVDKSSKNNQLNQEHTKIIPEAVYSSFKNLSVNKKLLLDKTPLLTFDKCENQKPKAKGSIRSSNINFRRQKYASADKNHDAQLRDLSVIDVINATATYVKQDVSFVARKNKNTKVYHIDVERSSGNYNFELAVTGQKWFDRRNESGGGGSFDVLMYLAGCDFKEARARLKDVKKNVNEMHVSIESHGGHTHGTQGFVALGKILERTTRNE